jgi:1-acyl-sn-glycerol-3-phosphate acyltransferase
VVPEPPAPLRDAVAGPTGDALYASGELFHGPSFHVVERVVARGSNGATLLFRSDRPIPPDVLLDGATHGIFHDRLEPGKIAYPYRIKTLSLFGAPPMGPVVCEVRQPDPARLEFTAHFYAGGALIAYFLLQEVLLPKGRIGEAPPALRRDFLLGRWAPGVSLSRIEGGRAELTDAEVKASDWLPGTIRRVYGTEDAREIANKELAAARHGVHPRAIALPDVNAWWRRRLGAGAWPGEALFAALSARFLDAIIVHDPDAAARVAGRRCLFLANHQSYLESVLFTCFASALFDTPLRALAKVEHQGAWLGELHALMTRYPGHELGDLIVWFEQKAPAELPRLVRAEEGSLLVHVEGTRQTVPGQPVEKLSSLWMDIAIERDMPIVPVAFRGGLAGGHKHDIPPRPQVHHVGRPILPTELAAMPYAERRRAVATAIDGLGVPETASDEAPREPREALREALAGFVKATDADPAWMGGIRRLIGIQAF